jgi:hypothetical protein
LAGKVVIENTLSSGRFVGSVRALVGRKDFETQPFRQISRIARSAVCPRPGFRRRQL